MDGEREKAVSSRGDDRVQAFLDAKRAEREARGYDVVAAVKSERAFHRQQRLEEFREIGRGIGEALAANLPSGTITAAIAAALKTAGLD